MKNKKFILNCIVCHPPVGVSNADVEIAVCPRCRLLAKETETKDNGHKFDTGKIRTDLIEPEWLEELAKVLTLGAINHSDRQWKKVEPLRFHAALLRHYIEVHHGKFLSVEKDINEKEHLVSHYAQVAVNALFCMSITMDEYNKQKEEHKS